MNKNLLIVVDMQNDFIDGVLGTPEAVAIVPAVKEKIKQYREAGNLILFTADTHGENYMNTQEGKRLPVPHCIENTHGWQICEELLSDDDVVCNAVCKPTFGCLDIRNVIYEILNEEELSIEDIDCIELVGLCTDICVISNAMILKASFPETRIVVDSDCCAGVTPERHNTALAAMTCCQIDVI